MKEERGVKTTLLNVGLGLAISFAGFLFSHLNNGRRRRIKSPTSGEAAVFSNCNTDSEGNFTFSEDTCINRMTSDSSPIALSPSSKQSGDREEFLLPEFYDLIKEVDFGATVVKSPLRKDVEAPRLKLGYEGPQKDEYEQEITQLRNMIKLLHDREQRLEVQLLEYCGLREQQTAIRELQNRLKISNMEVKMFNLKVKNLQSENSRLKEQVADHAKVLAELETTKAKVKMLNQRIRYEAEQNKEKIITLQQKVAKLENQEYKNAACDQDLQLKLQKLKDLESEAEELRKCNFRLQAENSELAQRLDSTQILANSVLEDPEANAVKQEVESLKQENERLTKEIEQLRCDRCSDLEELVYMRWINACLRYELRNYQPPPGKTVARDLSRSLSPTSEKKAKQLILEYAQTEGSLDFDIDQWTSSQDSFLTDSGECDDFSSVDNSSSARANTTSQTKFFGKLRRLIQGKDIDHNHSKVLSREKSGYQESSTSPRSSTLTGTEGHRSEFTTPIITSRSSFDLSRFTGMKEEDRRNSDSFVMGSGSSNRWSVSRGGSLGKEKYDLEKYAAALKDSRANVINRRRGRSASYS